MNKRKKNTSTKLLTEQHSEKSAMVWHKQEVKKNKQNILLILEQTEHARVDCTEIEPKY